VRKTRPLLAALLALALGAATAQAPTPPERPTTPSDQFLVTEEELARILQHVDTEAARTLVRNKASRVWVLGAKEPWPGFADDVAGRTVVVFLGSDELEEGLSWIKQIPARESEVYLCVLPGKTIWGLILANPYPKQQPDELMFFLGYDTKTGDWIYTADERLTKVMQSTIFQQLLAMAELYRKFAERGMPNPEDYESYVRFYNLVKPKSACVPLSRGG